MGSGSVKLFRVLAFHYDGEDAELLSHYTKHVGLDAAMSIAELVRTLPVRVEVYHGEKLLKELKPTTKRQRKRRKIQRKKKQRDLFPVARQTKMFPE